VKGRNLRSDLCHIAELLQYIDNGFAEYFQVVVLQLPLLTVERYLESARNKVEKKQAQSKHERRPDSPLNLGDLGNFCQKVFDRHMDCDRRRVSYETTDYLQEQMLNYLQDSFEIYYWQFMLDLFLQQSVNSRSLSATVVIRVLSSYKIEILHKTDVIRRHLAASGNKSGDEIEPLMKGIDARIAVLEGVWNKGMSDLEASDLFQSVFQAIKPGLLSPSPGVEPATPAQVFPAWPANQQSNPKVSKVSQDTHDWTSANSSANQDTIIFIILIAFFFVGSLIPCLLAFSIAQQTPGTGHITDADFWNLLQSSIMSILGSLMTMVPLMHGSRFSAAYAVTWLLWSAGVVCAIISVVLYLVCNPAFSSAVSYFGSIFSLMAVLATTQVVPRPAVSIGDKVK